MFSGIIEQKSPILAIQDGLFTVQNPFDVDELAVGQSIAHDGACMTLTTFDDQQYAFFAMEESLTKTNFTHKKVGDFFNIERCIQYGERVDGHLVSGHIDTTGTIQTINKADDGSVEIGIGYAEFFGPYVIAKGSIAINGVSLTVVADQTGYFSVRLIPFTQKLTNLGTLELGTVVNLEFDMMAKYAQKHQYNPSYHG